MSDQNCGNCRFWYADGQQAVCRRNPPQVFVMSAKEEASGRIDLKTTSCFPAMMEYGWCGEWTPRQPASVTVLQPGRIREIISEQEGLPPGGKPLG